MPAASRRIPPPRRRPGVTAHRTGPRRRAAPVADQTCTSQGTRAGGRSTVRSAPPASAGQGAGSAGATGPGNKPAAIAVDNRGGAMKNLMVPNIPLALIFFAASATVALRSAARRPGAPGPAAVTVIAGQSQGQPQPGVTAERHD